MNIKTININSLAVLTSIIIGFAFLASGCTATGMERSEKTGATMSAVENDINQSVEQMTVTNTSLQELVKPGQVNAKQAFQKYSENVDKMDKIGKRLLDRTDKMNAQGKDYFEEWRTQGNTYINSDIQALSEQRRADLSAVFAQISEKSVGVKGAFKVYLTDLNEIKTYLSNDLTPKGIESISSIANQAIIYGEDLKVAVNPVLTAIDKAKAELAQGGAQ